MLVDHSAKLSIICNYSKVFFTLFTIIFLSLEVFAANPTVSIQSPANNTYTANSSNVLINISVIETNANNMSNFSFNWNGTDTTFLNDSTLLFFNFDNVSAIG